MDSDGIEVRPIRRNNGDYHFNEVFFDNVRVPLDNIVGSMNDGWRINRTTMVGEHLTNFLGSQAAQAETVARVARTIDERSEEHTSELQSLMRSWYAVFCVQKKKSNVLLYHHRYKSRNTVLTTTTA